MLTSPQKSDVMWKKPTPGADSIGSMPLTASLQNRMSAIDNSPSAAGPKGRRQTSPLESSRHVLVDSALLADEFVNRFQGRIGLRRTQSLASTPVPIVIFSKGYGKLQILLGTEPSSK